ncbi:hypothetical protein KKE60_08365 [Patescibacteria group bacterium]|nr:hypothetical protein [Patescibacteria group bacterium]
MTKKGQKPIPKGVIRYVDQRAMELRYRGESIREIIETLKEEKIPNIPGQHTLRSYFRPGCRLDKPFAKYCEKANEELQTQAINSMGLLAKEAVKAIRDSIKDGNINLALRVLEQIKMLDAQVSGFAKPLSFERIIFNQNEPNKLPKESMVIDEESTDILPEPTEDNE